MRWRAKRKLGQLPKGLRLVSYGNQRWMIWSRMISVATRRIPSGWSNRTRRSRTVVVSYRGRIGSVVLWNWSQPKWLFTMLSAPGSIYCSLKERKGIQVWECASSRSSTWLQRERMSLHDGSRGWVYMPCWEIEELLVVGERARKNESHNLYSIVSLITDSHIKK